MTRYILDASLAARRFLPAAEENLSPEARELLWVFRGGAVELTVPTCSGRSWAMSSRRLRQRWAGPDRLRQRYLALAIATDTPLVTADERLANAVALYAPVRWLGAI